MLDIINYNYIKGERGLCKLSIIFKLCYYYSEEISFPKSQLIPI